jgi:hypothetical protein
MPRRRSQPKSRYCEPCCDCDQRMGAWQQRLVNDEDMGPDIVVLSYFVLCCLSANSPDLEIRTWAKRQLAYPVFDEERERERKRSRVVPLRRYQWRSGRKVGRD